MRQKLSLICHLDIQLVRTNQFTAKGFGIEAQFEISCDESSAQVLTQIINSKY